MQAQQIILICKICNESFSVPPSKLFNHSINSPKLYCSTKCQIASLRSGELRVCESCGKEFYAIKSRIAIGQARFCSHKCHGKEISTKLSCTCEMCGKAFLASPSQVKNGGGKHCSKACLGLSIRKTPNCVCIQCGKEFYESTLRISEGRGKYCSSECFSSRELMEESHNCEVCGKPFIAKNTRMRRGTVKYCSANCRGIGTSGEKSRNWLGGKSFEPYCKNFNRRIKKEVRDKFDGKCYLCDTIVSGYRLHVHHCDYNKSQGCSGMAWSLLPLCRSHHSQTNFKRYYWFALLRDYWLYLHIDFALKMSGLV